jgi:DNA-binding NarL/FixJ family response regulator
MPALHPSTATPAVPHVNAKLDSLHSWLRNLRLKLGNRLALLNPTSTSRTLSRQHHLHHFVDSLRDWPTTVTSIFPTAFASRFLGLGFGVVSREGGRLSLTGSQSVFQQPSQPFVLRLQLLILTPELRHLFGNVVLCHMPRLTAIAVPTTTFCAAGIKPLNNYDMSLVGEACNGREAIQQFRAHRPDVTLMDLQMPEMSGVDALIAIRNEFPDAKVIVLTTYAGDVQILRGLKAGAQAYLLKNTLHKELLDAIRAVHAGKKSLSPEASYEIAEHSTDDALTPAEILVLRLIAAGNANKQIADQLSITEETVKSRVKCILSKLGANDRTHAVMIGLRRGIIEQ